MTDIIERLRQYDDEIERLRKELAKAHRLLNQSIQWQREAEITKAKQAEEIERLRNSLEMGIRTLNDTAAEDEQLKLTWAEDEQLKLAGWPQEFK